MRRIQIYDTTLRDGTQGEGVSFSLQDKLHDRSATGRAGVRLSSKAVIRCRMRRTPSSSRTCSDEPLQRTRATAFGMTRRRGMTAAEDPGMQALLDSGAPVITIVGKTSDFHVQEVLRVSLEENLAMIADTIAVSCGRQVAK